MVVGCQAGPGLFAPCLWIESGLAAAFHAVVYVANDRIVSLFFPKYRQLNQHEKTSFRSNIGYLFNAAVCLVSIIHMLVSDYIALVSQDPLHAYPHLLSYYGPAILGFYVFKFVGQLAYEIQLSNATEIVMKSDGSYNRRASMVPLIRPLLLCFIIIHSLHSKLFGIYGFFIAIISFQEVFEAVTMLLRLTLKTASEKSRVYRIVNALQYITFPLLRWLSGPYSSYLLWRHFRSFVENVSWPVIAAYMMSMFYENLYTFLFGIQAVIYIVKPDFLKVPNID